MTGSGRRGGRGRGRGRGGGAGNGQPGGGQPNPVEFQLYASEQFDMSGCPAIVKPPTAQNARYRLIMPERQVLGDIVLWFAASAVAEPTASLVMWQATRQDKTWLSGYVEQSVPQLEVGVHEVSTSQKYMLFKLRSGLVPMPPLPPPAAAAAAEGPADAVLHEGSKQAAVADSNGAAPAAPTAAGVAQPAASGTTGGSSAGRSAGGAAAVSSGGAGDAPANQEKQPAAAADKHAQEQQLLADVKQAAKEATAKLEAAGKAVQEAAAQAAGKAADGTNATAGHASKEAAAALSNAASAARADASQAQSEARKVAHDAAAAAADKDGCSGGDGPRTQVMALGGIAAATVVVAGVVIGVLAGRRRKA